MSQGEKSTKVINISTNPLDGGEFKLSSLFSSTQKSKQEQQEQEQKTIVPRLEETDTESDSDSDLGLVGKSIDGLEDDDDSEYSTSSSSDDESQQIQSGGKSSDTSSIGTTDILSEDPLFLVLSQFLVSKRNTNIVDAIEKLNENIERLLKNK